MDDNLIVLLACAFIGFLAQFIDGSLGMAYGVTSNSFLLGVGIPPAMASASVHVAEVFTTAASGLSHFRLGNIDKDLFRHLLIPGVIGGFAGAYVLSNVQGAWIKAAVAVYLLIMGLRIIWKAYHQVDQQDKTPPLFPLGLIGGFLDAIGGGGWGPVVTSTLVANGNQPRFVIGSVNMSEFFVTLVEAITFLALLGTLQWPIVIGLIVGGLPAAPLAAVMSKRIPARTLMWIVGGLIIFLSLRTIYLFLAA